MISRKSTMALFASVVLPSLAVFADGGYVTLTENNSEKTGFAGASWSETVEDPSTRDYLVAGTTLKTMTQENVGARSLTFGLVDDTAGTFFAYYSTMFSGSGGVVFANGLCHIRATDVNIGGKASFVSPAKKPFIFHGGYRDKTLSFTNDVHSPASAGILVYSAVADGDSKNGPQPFTFAFKGDASDYLGTVVVTSQYNSAGSPVKATFALDGSASYFGGSVTIMKDAMFYPRIATSVETLTLCDGASMKMNAGHKLTVRAALNIEKRPFTITLSGAPASRVSEIVRHDLITMPADCGLVADDFFVENNSSSVMTIPWLKMEKSADGKTQTLYAQYSPFVKLLKDEEDAISYTDRYAPSSVTNGGYWEDGLPVHGGESVYLVSKLSGTTFMSFPYLDGSPYVFPAPALYFTANTVLFLRSAENIVSNIFFRGGSEGAELWGLRDNKNDITLRSDFFVHGLLTVNLRNETSIRLAGPVKGMSSARIVIRALSGSTTQCRGWSELNGDNSGYAGKIQVTANTLSGDIDRHASLIATDACNLGGRRDGFAHDALHMDRYGQLDVRGTFVLDEPTRGIFLGDHGRISVAEGNRLTVKQQLTVNGRAYKEGMGTLALGGDLRFLDDQANVTENIPAEATNRTFFVLGGVLEPISAHALDGLDLVFSNGVSKMDMALALDIGSEDAEMREKGICNVKSPSPLSVSWQTADAGKKLPVELKYGGEVPSEGYVFGIMTVKSGCESVFDLLNVVRPAGYSDYRLAFSQIADETAGTVTLAGKLKKYGTVFSIR